MHFRVIGVAVLTLVALALSRFLAPLTPAWLGERIGAGSVDTILQTLASSMLAVTIFSLTIMAGALQAAAANWTPRSHLVLRQDTITQGVLSNFLGAFIFSLLGIVMRAAGLFDDREIVALFLMALGVVVLVVVSLIRWIVHLEGLGSLTFTASRLEAEAATSVRRAAQAPCHGAHPFDPSGAQVPEGALKIRATKSGYLQQMFEYAIQSEAEERDLCVYVPVPVGGYVLEGQVIAHVSGTDELDLTAETVLRESLPLGADRSFEEDPVFGVVVLSEVAVRALSPGVNDPGTAIDVIYRLARVLAPARVGAMDEPENDRLWACPLNAEALIGCAFDPVARDAGNALEVHEALQIALGELADVVEDRHMQRAVREVARRSLARAEQSITFAEDLARLRAAKRAGPLP